MERRRTLRAICYGVACALGGWLAGCSGGEDEDATKTTPNGFAGSFAWSEDALATAPGDGATDSPSLESSFVMFGVRGGGIAFAVWHTDLEADKVGGMSTGNSVTTTRDGQVRYQFSWQAQGAASPGTVTAEVADDGSGSLTIGAREFDLGRGRLILRSAKTGHLRQIDVNFLGLAPPEVGDSTPGKRALRDRLAGWFQSDPEVRQFFENEASMESQP